MYKDASSFLVLVASKLGKTQASAGCYCRALSVTAASSWGTMWNSIRVFFTYIRHHIQSINGTRSPAQVHNMLLMTGKKTLIKITFRIVKQKRVPSQLNPHFPTWCVHELQDKCSDQHCVPWWLSLHSVIFKYNLNPVHFVHYLKLLI